MKSSKYLRIRGKVQGVLYRESMRQKALLLGVTGWVRNRTDGSVEALVQGEDLLVQEMVAWCKHGPAQAKVESVEITEATNESPLTQFLRKDTE